MEYPRTPAEFRDIVLEIAKVCPFGISDENDKVFQYFQQEDVHQALQEVLRAIEGAFVGESTPTACERLCGAMFVFAVEDFVTKSTVVTNFKTKN